MTSPVSRKVTEEQKKENVKPTYKCSKLQIPLHKIQKILHLKKLIEFTKQIILTYIWLVSNVVNNKRNWKLKLSLGAREKLIALTIWKH